MFFSSIVRSISCTDEKNQNNRVRLVPVYIEIARTRVPKPALVVSPQDRHFHDRREATSEWPFWTWFIDNPRPRSSPLL
jgi:hypothetical protein